MAGSELCAAAQKGDCGKLRELLALLDGGGASSDKRTEVIHEATGEKVQTTALIEAVASGHHAAVELLLEHNADPNNADSFGWTLLMAAATLGHLPILQTLLDRKDIAIDAVTTETNCTAFIWACFRGHADCATELARRGCDMTLRAQGGKTGKDIAEEKKHTAVLEGLRALVVEQLRTKQKATAKPQDPLPAATTALELRVAAQRGDCGKLRELLDGGGASVVDERSEVIDAETGTKAQVSALIAAVKFGQHAVVDLLLEHNADPNRADSLGCTPLMHAAGGGCLSILRTLLDRKATAIDAVGTVHGYTAFHCACVTGNAECAVELARRGCNMDLRDTQGLTGLDLARQEGHSLLITRCKLVQKLAQRKAQQQSGSSDESSAAAAFPDTTAMPRLNEDEKRAKAAKKAAANRKKKHRKKAQKAAAAQQQLLSQAAEPDLQAESEPDTLAEEPTEPEPEIDSEADPDIVPDAEPELELEDTGTLAPESQALAVLTELGVQQWSAAQVLEWVALADLPPASVAVVCTVIEALDLDGEELLELGLKTLQKKLTKHGAQDAEALGKQMIEQRDALLLPGDSTAAACPDSKQQRSNSPECPICMELFCDDASGQYVPRILTNCGHTVCHGCITQLLSQGPAVKKNKKKKNGAKACKCPSCEVVTEVEGGDAASLHRNYALTSAVEEAD